MEKPYIWKANPEDHQDSTVKDLDIVDQVGGWGFNSQTNGAGIQVLRIQ